MPPFLNITTGCVHQHVMRPAECAPVDTRAGPRYVSGKRVELLSISEALLLSDMDSYLLHVRNLREHFTVSISIASLNTMARASTKRGNRRTTTTPAYSCFLQVNGGGSMNISNNFGLSRGCMTKRGHFMSDLRLYGRKPWVRSTPM